MGFCLEVGTEDIHLMVRVEKIRITETFLGSNLTRDLVISKVQKGSNPMKQ